jgi:hypothetical protein
MNNTSFEITDFLLEQARKIRGKQEFEDYETYTQTPREALDMLPKSVRDHFRKVMRTMEKMASYGNNHWWVMLTSNEATKTAELASLRKKARIYFQVFDCGVDTMLLPDGQLVNDINDQLTFTNKTITSWIIKNPSLFAGYKEYLKKKLDNDNEFQLYLKELESL